MNPYNDTREIFYNTKMNKNVLENFKKGEVNLLVASNVLEEGIDVQTCSLVVHFDELTNYRAYIQSKGRARHLSSSYYMLVSSHEMTNFKKKYQNYQEVEDILNCYLIGQNEKRNKSSLTDMESEQYSKIPTYYVNGPGSSQVNLLTAVPLLCSYCQSLPSDNYTTYTPNWFLKTHSGSGKYRVTIELPTVSGILDPIEGSYMPSKRLAKRTAALKTCILLHQKGELDDALRPVQRGIVDINFSNYFSHWPVEKEKNAGNTKQQRVYDKKLPDVCKGLIAPNQVVYLHIIELMPLFSRSNQFQGVNTMCDLYQSSLCYGILSAQTLPKICSFRVYVSAGEILVNFNVNYKRITLSSQNISHLRSFHCVVFNKVLNIFKPFLVLDNEINNNGLLVVPVRRYSQHYEIDFNVAMQHEETIDFKTRPTDQERLSLIVTKDSHERAIVTPWYRSDDKEYLVMKVCEDLNALSKFPTKQYETYESYYKQKYNVPVLNKNQPLLIVKALSKKINCLKPRLKGHNKSIERNEEFEEHLIPELCKKQEFPATLWLQAKLLPSILYRILSLLQADELRVAIGNESGLGVRQLSDLENWAPLVLDNNVVNSSVKEKHKSVVEKGIQNIFELTTTKLNKDFTVKKLSGKYPWKESEEPIDIERHLDVPSIDVQYFENFVSQKMPRDYVHNKNKIANRSNFQQDYPYKEIQFLKHFRNGKGPDLIDLFTVLATEKSNDIVSLERLETLGDSFLKVSISLFLILKYQKFDEGRLTSFKGQLISNKNLFYIGIKKSIPGYIKVSEFNPDYEWKPPSFSVPKILKERISKSIPINSLFRFNFTKEEIVSGTISHESQYHITAQCQKLEKNTDDSEYNSMYSFLDRQMVKDKTIADCIEALLGVYFQSYGFKGGLIFLKWLGIVPPSENIDKLLNMAPPNPVLNENATESNITFHIPTWKKVEDKLCYKFKNRGYLLQALTHSSYTPNRITNCYQTLEFLGDAVLDFLITCHIYETCENLTPGDLTDLRSALVNNVTFACFAVRCGFQKHLQFSNSQLLRYITNFVQHQEANGHAINEDVLILMNENDMHLAEHIDVPKALGDVFEAIIGAVFLDSGMCFETVWKIVHRIMSKEIELFKINVPKNPVRLIHETVRAHPIFQQPVNMDNGRTMVQLDFMLNGKRKSVYGYGENKSLAKKAAAKIALRLLHE